MDQKELSPRKAGLGLFLILVVAFCFRLATALWSYSSTFDTATVGLMAVNILEKGERPLFFYGQRYFGALEAYLAALIFLVFGVSEISLSMAPILCSLGWIVATYQLFKAWNGRAAGLVAASIIAIPSHVILRYSVGSDGGYPLAFMLGTLSLWICLELFQRNIEGRKKVATAIALGTIAGFGIWTHPITMVYLLPGALLLGCLIACRDMRKDTLIIFVAASFTFFAIITFFDAWPLGMPKKEGGLLPPISIASMYQNFTGMFDRPLRQHLFNHWEAGWLWWILRGLILFTGLLYAFCLARCDTWRTRLRLAMPLIFAISFCLLYSIHPMARAEAPRYVIPLWTILLSGLIGAVMTAPSRRIRLCGRGVLTCWILFYGVSNAMYVASNTKKREILMASRHWIVEKANEVNLASVVVVDSPIYAHYGQIYSFTSKGQIAFVSPFDERHQPSAEFAERDPACGMLIATANEQLLMQALNDIDASWSREAGYGYSLFYDIRATAPQGPIIPGSSIKIDKPGFSLDTVSDRNMSTSIKDDFKERASFIIQLDQPRTIEALVMIGHEVMGRYLPRIFRLEGSIKGSEFTEIRAPGDRITLMYTAGNKVWVAGYNARLECRFPPIEVDRLRITPLEGQRGNNHPWSISEVYIHEASSGTSWISIDEICAIAGKLYLPTIHTVVADRWMNARLAEVWHEKTTRPILYPRRNPKYKHTLIDRNISLEPGTALVVSTALADETEEIIASANPEINLTRTPTGKYTIFTFGHVGTNTNSSLSFFWFDGYLMRSPSMAAGYGAD